MPYKVLKGPIWIVDVESGASKVLARYCYSCRNHVSLYKWTKVCVEFVQKRCDDCIDFAVQHGWG